MPFSRRPFLSGQWKLESEGDAGNVLGSVTGHLSGNIHIAIAA